VPIFQAHPPYYTEKEITEIPKGVMQCKVGHIRSPRALLKYLILFREVAAGCVYINISMMVDRQQESVGSTRDSWTLNQPNGKRRCHF
jgi:hypothetical protein